MEFTELLKFIDLEDQRLKNYYGNYIDEEKRILARTVKLTEELGELCNEVLAANSLQRKQKLDKTDKNNLGEEFADVIITALLLSKSMNIDIEKLYTRFSEHNRYSLEDIEWLLADNGFKINKIEKLTDLHCLFIASV